MWIPYIDRQQYLKCDQTINICVNAHGKCMASTNKRQTWELISERWIACEVVGHIGTHRSKEAEGFVAFNVALVTFWGSTNGIYSHVDWEGRESHKHNLCLTQFCCFEIIINTFEYNFRLHCISGWFYQNLENVFNWSPSIWHEQFYVNISIISSIFMFSYLATI